ncbi:MAG: transglutaminase-like domain-containing protein, partial [Candidatus Dojkabacteria bacterium]
MRNLIGYLKKTLLISSFCFLILFPIKNIYALEGFDIKSDYSHVWDGTTVNSTIYFTISTTTPRVITYYTITLPEENLKPEIFLLNKNMKLEPTYHNRTEATDLVIDLKNSVVYPDKPITLKLTYSTPTTSTSHSLISAIKDTTSRSFTFMYPKKYGGISWSSTPIERVTQKGENIEVESAPPQGAKLKISLGEKITYDFKISRNLINSSEETISSEINLPPNSNSQKLIITKIQPKPDKSYKDINGNYILQYQIAPQSNIDVAIEGQITMLKTTYKSLPSLSIEQKSIWDIKSSELIKRLEKYLDSVGLKDIHSVQDLSVEKREMLYKSLYYFVIENLEPNTLTVGSLVGSARLGGESALSQQAKSTSEDYADSIISLFRYYKIPTRLVIGYVTNISDYHPDGIYHYWAEYLDIDKREWKILDPFLEDYSKASLLNRDLSDHVSLLFRYDNPNTPKLSYYSENDFLIEQSREEKELKYDIEAEFILKPYTKTDSHLQGSIMIKNIGNTVLDS